MEEIRPFIKWAGGKKSLIPQISSYYPNELIDNKIDTYIEPFVGGGAILIDVLQKYNIKKAYALDINKDLINCYRVIKKDVENLINALSQKEKEYKAFETMNEKSDYYYKVRDAYNNNQTFHS